MGVSKNRKKHKQKAKQYKYETMQMKRSMVNKTIEQMMKSQRLNQFTAAQEDLNIALEKIANSPSTAQEIVSDVFDTTSVFTPAGESMHDIENTSLPKPKKIRASSKKTA